MPSPVMSFFFLYDFSLLSCFCFVESREKLEICGERDEQQIIEYRQTEMCVCTLSKSADVVS